MKNGISTNPNRLMMAIAEKVRKDVELLYPQDKTANKLATEMLYHICWKVADEEKAVQ